MGGHGVPAGGDRGHAAVREARRPVRAQGRPAGRAGAVPGRLRPVRARAGDDRADRVPVHPGARRRRADGQRAGGGRRRRVAGRPRPLHGPVRRGLRGLVRRRAAARRVHDHPHLLALDLLREPAAGRAGADRAGGDAAHDHRAPLARDRLPRHAAARARPQRDHPADDAGREHVRMGIARDHRHGRLRRRLPGRADVRGAARRRADPAAHAVQEPGVHRHQRGRRSSSASRCSAR